MRLLIGNSLVDTGDVEWVKPVKMKWDSMHIDWDRLCRIQGGVISFLVWSFSELADESTSSFSFVSVEVTSFQGWIEAARHSLTPFYIWGEGPHLIHISGRILQSPHKEQPSRRIFLSILLLDPTHTYNYLFLLPFPSLMWLFYSFLTRKLNCGCGKGIEKLIVFPP